MVMVMMIIKSSSRGMMVVKREREREGIFNIVTLLRGRQSEEERGCPYTIYSGEEGVTVFGA